MLIAQTADNFESWRNAARDLLSRGVRPENIVWNTDEQTGLFQEPSPVISGQEQRKVPAEFIKLAKAVACFDEKEKWPLLYRILFRLSHENANLLFIESDKDVRDARVMEKAVSRDVHKFHAFVRFRTVVTDEQEIYVAWHEPQHLTVERSTPFFVRRFGTMNFSILTPKGCAHWDTQKLTFGPPAERKNAPAADASEDHWLTYYRSIFNPFRLKVKAMKKEFPVRHWATLPEAVLIPELIREARGK
jgi:probable DNA metabolism protein